MVERLLEPRPGVRRLEPGPREEGLGDAEPEGETAAQQRPLVGEHAGRVQDRRVYFGRWPTQGCVGQQTAQKHFFKKKKV